MKDIIPKKLFGHDADKPASDLPGSIFVAFDTYTLYVYDVNGKPQPEGGSGSTITLDTSSFNGALSATEDNAQKAFDVLDDDVALNTTNSAASKIITDYITVTGAVDLDTMVTDVISQVDAEAGTATDSKIWTAERVAQAIAALGGTGDVTKVGTPVNNELAVWTGDGTLESEDNLTFSGSNLYVGKYANTVGYIELNGGGTTVGGELRIWNGATDDGTEQYYRVRASDEIFRLAGNATGDFLTYTTATEVVNITKELNVASETKTGVALDLASAIGKYYNMASANAGETYTFSGAVTGGWAQSLINTTNEPDVTNATKIGGATFVTATNMYLVVRHNGTTTEFWFLEI